MWAYLAAHAGLALLHHLLGSDIFSRMFLSRRVVAKVVKTPLAAALPPAYVPAVPVAASRRE